MTHHPTWTEIRAEWLKDPEFVKALEEPYAPVARDRAAERCTLQQKAAVAKGQ